MSTHKQVTTSSKPVEPVWAICETGATRPKQAREFDKTEISEKGLRILTNTVSDFEKERQSRRKGLENLKHRSKLLQPPQAAREFEKHEQTARQFDGAENI